MKQKPMPQQTKKSLVLAIYFALAVSTLLVFWQVRNFDFVNYDDEIYVYENPHVLNGLTTDGVIWAFNTGYFGNWNPLTWLSYMLDSRLFGSNPAGFHLTNLFFHIANTLLLFFVLKQMTKAIWQSAFVAALFAIHPLHVEAVAWISCRKDVLSTFFWLLTMWAYLRYVKQPVISRYLLVLLAFAMGIMAKPMVVTLPFVLLLLDYWPLDRILSFQLRTLYRLILEKIPLLVLAAVFSVIAFFTQQSFGALAKFTEFSLKFRVYNALISYLKYIEKMFRPDNLTVFYPHPFENVSVLYALIAAAGLLAVTILVIRFAKNHRYLITGWFWYLGTLVPVIGIIQLGDHAMADRYTYITLTGLFIIVAWGLPELLAKLPQRKIALGALMAIVLSALGICAHQQTSYWNNSVNLFSHALDVTQNNYVAYNNLGAAFANLDRYTEAMEAHTQTIKINPNYAQAFHNLGNDYKNLGRSADAIEAYKQAIKIDPNYINAYINLGIVLDKLGRTAEAVDFYKQAIKIRPDSSRAYFNLGVAFDRLNLASEAIDAFRQAVKINPDYAKAYNNLGNIYSKLTRYTEAIEAFKQVVRIRPDYAQAHEKLGLAYLSTGDKTSALAEYNILKSLNPHSADNLLKEINK